jgi:hypothetical protein
MVSSPLKYSVAHDSNVRFAGKTGTLKTCPTFFNGLLELGVEGVNGTFLLVLTAETTERRYAENPNSAWKR